MERFNQVLSKSCLHGGFTLILSIFGTTHVPMDRLLKALEDYHLKTGEKIIAQIGGTRNKRNILECYKFIPNNQLKILISKASLVICHGGLGTIKDCFEVGAKVLAISRSVENKECSHNQNELLKKLAEENKITILEDLNNLELSISKVREKEKYKCSNNKICDYVEELINSYW